MECLIKNFIKLFNFTLYLMIYDLDFELMKDKTNKEEGKKNIYIALLLQFVATIWFSLMNVLCKDVYFKNKNLNGFDYLLIRSISIISLSVIQIYYQKSELI